MKIEEQWFLDNPFDKNGNEIIGWHFTSGKWYDTASLCPFSTKIRQTGTALPVSFGGMDVPYVNYSIKNALSKICRESIQFIPTRVTGKDFEYYIMNLLDLVDAVDESSEVEYYTKEQVLDFPERAGRIKYLRKLVLNKNKIPKEKKIFRLRVWKNCICIDEEVKEMIENTENNHGMSFKKIPLI